jgi:sugar phosphate permease
VSRTSTPHQRAGDPTLVHPLGGRRAWAVWAAAISVYVLAVFHRTSLGVAGLVAAERFHISSAQLATFTMVQLFVYAGMQIPVGAILDRVGSRRMLITGVALMSCAQLGFAFAGTFAEGILARVFVGMGDAMVFISLLRLVALWFPPGRTAMITQVTGVLGQLGALASAAPLALALSAWGWTPSFATAAAVGVLLGVVLVLVVRDSPYASHDREELKVRAVARAVRLAWGEPGTRLGLWSHFSAQFGSNVFALLWGFPFLVSGQGLSTGTASAMLMLMTVTTVIASPIVGTFVTRWPYSRSTLVLWIVAAIMLAWAVVLLWPGRAPLPVLALLVVVISLGGPGSMVGFDLARTFNPPTRIGSATGIVNVGGFLAALSTIALIGLVLDHVAPGGPSTYTTDSFRVAMSVQYLVWVVGVVQIVRFRRRTRRAIAESEDGLYAAMRPSALRAG